MFGWKKRVGRPSKRSDERAVYRQVAVSPAAHAKLREMANNRNMTIIDTVNKLLGV